MYGYKRRGSSRQSPAASFQSAVNRAKDGAHTYGVIYEVLADGKVVARCRPEHGDHLRAAPKCVMVSDHKGKRRGSALNGLRRRKRR